MAISSRANTFFSVPINIVHLSFAMLIPTLANPTSMQEIPTDLTVLGMTVFSYKRRILWNEKMSSFSSPAPILYGRI